MRIRHGIHLSRRAAARFALAIGLGAAAHAGAHGAEAQLELSAGIHRIRAEVANTFSARTEGLMHRQGLPASQGMLFVFPETGIHCMWMRNTLIPLSAAFIDAQGTIVKIAEMQPQTLDHHCPDKPVKFVLEMNGNWFKGRGIAPGAKVTGLEQAPPGR